MGDDSITKKSRPPLIGMIYELAHHREIARRNMLPHAPGGTDRYQVLDSKLLHPVDICAIVQLAGQDSMAAPMTREEDYLSFSEVPAIIRVRRRAEGGGQVDLLDRF